MYIKNTANLASSLETSGLLDTLVLPILCNLDTYPRKESTKKRVMGVFDFFLFINRFTCAFHSEAQFI